MNYEEIELRILASIKDLPFVDFYEVIRQEAERRFSRPVTRREVKEAYYLWLYR